MSLWYRHHEGIVSSPTLDPADPYGIALVSGFYGPGSWSGWILAVVASATRIHTNPHAKLDPNTWLFVLGTNWAAVDIFRILWASSLTRDGSTKAIGHISAALTLAFWGNIYAAAQIVVLVARSKPNKVPTQRIVTQTLGLVLPSFAQTAVFLSVSNENTILGGGDIHTIPFLYFGVGFDVRGRRDTLLGFFCSTFVYSILICIALPFFLVMWLYQTQGSVRSATQGLICRCKGWKRRCVIVYLISHLFSGTTYIMLSDWTYHKTHESSFMIIFWCFFPILFPMAILATAAYAIHFVFIICGYFFTTLITGFKSWRGACFFMPCAPQSITEWDQAYSLLVGLILLFGIEILPAIMEYTRDRRRFVKDLESRMEASRQQRCNRNPRSSLDITTQRRLADDAVELQELLADNGPDDPLPCIRGQASYNLADVQDDGMFLASSAGTGSRQQSYGRRQEETREKAMLRLELTTSHDCVSTAEVLQEQEGDILELASVDDDVLAPTKASTPLSQRAPPKHEHMMTGALPFGYFYMSAS